MQYIKEEDFEEKGDIINISYIRNRNWFNNILLIIKNKNIFYILFFFLHDINYIYIYINIYI